MLTYNFSIQQNKTTNYTSKNLQIVAQIINVLNFAFSLWVFLSLRKFVKLKNKLMASNNLRKKIVVLSAYTPIIPLVRIISSQVVLSISWFATQKNDKLCETVLDASMVFYYLALLPVFNFLWVKQRFLYKQPSMRHLNTTKLKTLSYFSVFLAPVAGMLTCVLFVIPNSFVMLTPSMECKRKSDVVPIVKHKMYHISSMAVILGTQLILFVLFVYPLVVYKKGKTMNKNRLVIKKITATLQHAAISNGIMTSSIVITLVLLTTVLKNFPSHILNSFYDLGMCFILFSVVVSFENWKNIFTFSLRKTSMNRKCTYAAKSIYYINEKSLKSLNSLNK